MSGAWTIFCTKPAMPKPVELVTYLTQHHLSVSVSETQPEYLDMWAADWEQIALRTPETEMAILLSCTSIGDGDFAPTIQFWMDYSQQGCLNLFTGWHRKMAAHLQKTRYIIEMEYGGLTPPELIILLLTYFEQKFGGLYVISHPR